MTADPKPGAKCANCGRPRPTPERANNRAQSGTRMPVDIWIVNVKRDPFCSAECCRTFYGLRTTARPQSALGCCPDCGKQHTTANQRPSGNRCGSCATKFKRRRRFDIPGRCSGCAIDLAEFTDGCHQCYDRRRSRERWADPVYAEAARKRQREQKRARYARKTSSARRLAAVEPSPTASAPASGGPLQDTPAPRKAEPSAGERRAA